MSVEHLLCYVLPVGFGLHFYAKPDSAAHATCTALPLSYQENLHSVRGLGCPTEHALELRSWSNLQQKHNNVEYFGQTALCYNRLQCRLVQYTTVCLQLSTQYRYVSECQQQLLHQM